VSAAELWDKTGRLGENGRKVDVLHQVIFF
jgi:hypothetical protein